MRLRLFTIVLACLTAATAAQAQTQEGPKVAELGLYYQALVVENEQPVHRGFIQGWKSWSEKSGVWGFGYGEKDYFSGVLGLYYDLFAFGETSVFEVGLAAGAEKMEGKLYNRFAGDLFIGNDNLYLDVYYENGESKEWWLKVDALWQIKKHLAVSVLHQTLDGTGVRGIFGIPKTPLKFWVGPMFSKEDRKLLLGIDLVGSQKK